MQRLLAITWLTWKAALRFRLFLVLTALLLVAVVGLPLLIKDDGTARGFTQILLTYTLSSITGLLGLSTLWLACGTLARDIEECQIQVVATKPIARWQIWLGKWLGIMTLNAVLLLISGASVYGLLQWRATKLPKGEQEVLRNEVLVARGSAREKSFESEIESELQKRMEKQVSKDSLSAADLADVSKQIREQLKAQIQVVPPGAYRPWRIDLGVAKNWLHGRPLQLRIKFNAAQKTASGTFIAMWQVGVPDETPIWRSEAMSLSPDTFHEFEIPADLFDENGKLSITFVNANSTALLFPLEDGMEVLYRQGGFAMNFVRGLGIIFCWMALMAAVGLMASSFLSFPVAAFFSLAMLAVVFSSGTIANSIENGTIAGVDETGKTAGSVLDAVAIPIFKVALNVINMVQGFSPIDALSTGRSITWEQLARAVVQVVLLMGGLIGLFGIFMFNRRELATAQNQS